VKVLMIHADYFKYEAIEKTRISEEVDEDERVGGVNGPVLVVFVCSEKIDERDPPLIARRTVESIIDIAKQVNVRNIVLHSFAHLSDSLSSPDIAKRVINEINQMLKSSGYYSSKTPFGWRDTFELRAKGHPVSKVSRKIVPE